MVSTPKPTHLGTGRRSRISARGLSRAGIAVVCIAGLLGVFLWFYVPIEVCDSINKRLDKLPDYRGHVERIRINIWDASVDVMDVNLAKRSADLAYPLFVSHQINVAVHWSALLHGNLRNSVTIYNPNLHFIAGPSDGQSQLSIIDLMNEIKNLALFRINRVTVENGDVHFHDFHSQPPVSLEMNQVNVTADNLTNGEKSSSHLPCKITATGRPLKEGYLDLTILTNLDINEPTFSEKLEVRKVPAVTLNAGLKKYLNVQAKSGYVELYSDVNSDYGNFRGYAKPFLENLEFEPTAADKGTPIELWSDMLNGVKKLFENHYDTIATRVELTGRFNDPQVNVFSAFFGVLKNAYFQILNKGFEPQKGSVEDESKIPDMPKTSNSITVQKDSSKPR